MSTHLIIAGHGQGRKSFDPGASGYIKKGEHRYMVENLFPEMKKFIPKGEKVIFHTAYDVYDRRNILALARKYGKDVIVSEFHFDAASASASGGHVIVYKGFKPDKIDIALRDAIEKNVGVANRTHCGYKGISGRNDLYNLNQCAHGGINYRLIELGFGTNKKDANYLLTHTEQYAKDLMKALTGQAVNKTASVSKPAAKSTTASKRKTVKQLADEVMAGKHGDGAARKRSLGSQFDAVQAEINRRYNVKNSAPQRKSAEQLADEVMAGKHGSGEARKRSLGSRYDEVQAVVNRRYGVSGKSSKKSIDTIAREVIRGDWGNGRDRESRLHRAGYDPSAVQRRVNQLHK